MLAKTVYILIVNWNGWADTIECLESVFRNDYPDYKVIVCDNDSSDNSVEKIKSWANGRLNIFNTNTHPPKSLSWLPVAKPIRYQELHNSTVDNCSNNYESTTKLTLINTGSNLGFAGGNNVGLRYAILNDDFSYVWLLNNDTVIHHNALSQMVSTMSERPSAGICGSTLLCYMQPGIVQVLGGAKYNCWLGTCKKNGAYQKLSNLSDTDKYVSNFNYIEGASMLVSCDFLHRVGLLSEDYFLYFEEIDWAMRAQGTFTLTFAPKSHVYHKEGASIGSSCDQSTKSLTAEYYFMRSRLIFTKKYYPFALPTIYINMIVALINRIRKHQWKKFKIIVNLMLQFRNSRPPDIQTAYRYDSLSK